MCDISLVIDESYQLKDSITLMAMSEISNSRIMFAIFKPETDYYLFCGIVGNCAKINNKVFIGTKWMDM